MGGDDLITGESEGRRPRFLYLTEHQSAPVAGSAADHGRHQLIHRGTSRRNGQRFRFLAVRHKHGYITGGFLRLFLNGTLVPLVGLTMIVACPKIFCTVFWNPPDLFMTIVDGRKGSSGSRAAECFLYLGFGPSVRGCSLRCGPMYWCGRAVDVMRRWVGVGCR